MSVQSILEKYKDQIPYDKIISELQNVNITCANQETTNELKLISKKHSEALDTEHRTYNESINEQNKYEQKKQVRYEFYETAQELILRKKYLTSRLSIVRSKSSHFKTLYSTSPIDIKQLSLETLRRIVKQNYGITQQYNKKDTLDILTTNDLYMID